jgi:hypothetical protein
MAFVASIIFKLSASFPKENIRLKLLQAIQKGHDQLLEIRLLEKTGRHNFSTAQRHLSKCHFFVNWLNPVNLLGSTGFDQFHF